MVQNITLCSRFGGVPKCEHCNDQNCIKNGKTSNGKQRYQCRKCGKKFITEYTYQAYNPNINRLTEAWYQVPGTGVNHSYDEYLAYDRNGNITALERYGEIESASTLEKIDNLVYDYDDGNRLINVTDGARHPAGFDDGNIHNESGNDDFEYDAFGNLVIDRNKDITSVSYNHLNLPKKVVFHEGESEILYLYDANGVKMEKITKQEHQVIKKVNYQGAFQYTDEEMDFIQTAEGYTKVTHNEENIPYYNYVFNYTDHLGNVRVSWTQNPEAPEELVIIGDNHYYPFGLAHKGYQSHPQVHYWAISFQQVALTPVSSLYPESYKYKFNGKEWQDELGLNVYDYGARNYMPDLGRYFNMDKFSEAYVDLNPYQYTANNPIKFIDVNGDYIYIWEGKNRYRYEDGEVQEYDKESKEWKTHNAKEGSYVAQILGYLNDITGGDENSFGSWFLGLFENDNINVELSQNTSTGKRTKGRTITQGTNIYTYSNQKESVRTTGFWGSEQLSKNYHVTLFHELGHGFANNVFNASVLNAAWVKDVQTERGVEDVSKSEVFASMVENMLRAEQGLNLRTHYIGGSSDERSRLIIKSKTQSPFSRTYEPTEATRAIWNEILKSRKE